MKSERWAGSAHVQPVGQVKEFGFYSECDEKPLEASGERMTRSDLHLKNITVPAMVGHHRGTREDSGYPRRELLQ